MYLSVDPASNKVGVALWSKELNLLSVKALTAPAGEPFTVRLSYLRNEMSKWLKGVVVTEVVTENVRSSLVMVSIGALIAVPEIRAILRPKSFVSPTSWKAYAKRNGAQGPLKDIKGLRALDDMEFPYPENCTDDCADAILLFLTYKSKFLT